jgi:hypothetical protein
VLEGWILDTLDPELGTRRDDPWPTKFLESPGRYGVVALILPQSFAIEALGSP